VVTAPDPYAVLGVPRGASDEEIARAYRRLARRLHPDASGGSADAFAAVADAYAVLSAPGSRAHDPSRAARPARRGVSIPVRHTGTPGADVVSAELRVRWPDAVLGARLVVRTPAGPVQVDLPPGTAPGTVLPLPGAGTDGSDLALVLQVDVPRELDPAEQQAVRELASVLRPPSGRR
jgi:DnaJ-class molecular chaperone